MIDKKQETCCFLGSVAVKCVGVRLRVNDHVHLLNATLTQLPLFVRFNVDSCFFCL